MAIFYTLCYFRPQGGGLNSVGSSNEHTPPSKGPKKGNFLGQQFSTNYKRTEDGLFGNFSGIWTDSTDSKVSVQHLDSVSFSGLQLLQIIFLQFLRIWKLLEKIPFIFLEYFQYYEKNAKKSVLCQLYSGLSGFFSPIAIFSSFPLTGIVYIQKIRTLFKLAMFYY